MSNKLHNNRSRSNELGSNELHNNNLHSQELRNDKSRSDGLHRNELHSNEQCNKKVSMIPMIKKILEGVREGFRYRKGRLEDILMDKISNPTPRSELFPYRFYDEEEEVYYSDDNIVGFVFEGNTAVGIDDAFYKQISMLFDDQLPEGGVLEVLLLASDDLSPAIDKWKKARMRREGIYRKLEEYRIEFFNKYNEEEERSFKHRNYRLFFSYSNNLYKKKEYGGVEKVIKFRGRLKSILSGIGIEVENVGVDEFIKVVKEITNYPDFKDFGSVDTNRANTDKSTSVSNTTSSCNASNDHNNHITPYNISDQICDVSNALLVEEEGVLLDGGKYTTRVYEVEHYPEEFSIGRMACLLGDVDSDNMQIPSRFGIIYTIANEIRETEQEGYKKKGELVVKQASGMLGRFNRVLEEEGKEWNEIIQNNLKRREKFLRRTLMIMVTARSGKIEIVEQNLMSLWRRYDFIIKPLRYFQLPGLLGFCPFLNKTGLGKLYKKFGIKKTVLSSEAKALLPIHGEWKGTQNGGMILTGRRGQVFTWNNFEGGNNYNACIIGESGSGKSVFLQEFVMTHLAQETKVFVVDIGRSFEKTCKIMGGDFLSFGSGSKTSLNPFSNIPEEGKYNPKEEESEERENITQDSLNYLKKIIGKMVAPIYGTTDIQNATIAISIHEVWEKYKSKANIDKLVEILNEKGEREKDLGLMLYEYTSRGNYGRFFNGKENVKFDKQLTVLEFEELREQPELGGVIMQMLAIQIVQQVYLGDRRQKFIILFDEAWYALENFPLFLASMAKTVRKYNGGLILGTQSLKNFYGGEGKDGMQGSMDIARMGVIENSAWRVLLKQSGESVESLAKMKLPKELFSVVKNLTTSKGEYSEMLIYQSEKQYFVSRLMLDKFSQVLYSSSPEVFGRVKGYIDEGIGTAEAVERVLDDIKSAGSQRRRGD